MVNFLTCRHDSSLAGPNRCFTRRRRARSLPPALIELQPARPGHALPPPPIARRSWRSRSALLRLGRRSIGRIHRSTITRDFDRSHLDRDGYQFSVSPTLSRFARNRLCDAHSREAAAFQQLQDCWGAGLQRQALGAVSVSGRATYMRSVSTPAFRSAAAPAQVYAACWRNLETQPVSAGDAKNSAARSTLSQRNNSIYPSIRRRSPPPASASVPRAFASAQSSPASI